MNEEKTSARQLIERREMCKNIWGGCQRMAGKWRQKPIALSHRHIENNKLKYVYEIYKLYK